MWTRRQFFKSGLSALIGTTGIFYLQKHYKQKHQIVDIVEFPHPILRRISQPIDVTDDSIDTLAKSMTAILQYSAPFAFLLEGALYRGLAAPQIGIQKRMIVCGLRGEIKVLINPEIITPSFHLFTAA